MRPRTPSGEHKGPTRSRVSGFNATGDRDTERAASVRFSAM